jgi:hypothetical protein
VRTMLAILLSALVVGAIAVGLAVSMPGPAARVIAVATLEQVPAMADAMRPQVTGASGALRETEPRQRVCVQSLEALLAEPDPADLDTGIDEAGGTNRRLRTGAFAGSASELAEWRAAKLELETESGAILSLHKADGEYRENWSRFESAKGHSVWMLSGQSRVYPCGPGEPPGE